jgi:glycopeptide antibiotics resistance protein
VQLSAPPQPHRRLWLLLGWGMVFSVMVLSLIPLNIDLQKGGDKIAHFTAYGSMTFWFAMLFTGRVRQLGIAAAFAAMGVGIEFLQGMTDYRTFEIADMIANALGAALGWGLAQTPVGNALTWMESLLDRLAREPAPRDGPSP